jgi:hypothetical protein
MSANTLIRIKYYVLILILSAMNGSLLSKHRVVELENGGRYFRENFNLPVFFIFLAIGYTPVFLYDWYIYFKNRK